MCVCVLVCVWCVCGVRWEWPHLGRFQDNGSNKNEVHRVPDGGVLVEVSSLCMEEEGEEEGEKEGEEEGKKEGEEEDGRLAVMAGLSECLSE